MKSTLSSHGDNNLDETLYDMMLRRGSSHEWKFLFRRRLLLWEEEEAHRLTLDLNNNPVTYYNRVDRILWKANSARFFYVGSLYKLKEDVLGSLDSCCYYVMRSGRCGLLF